MKHISNIDIKISNNLIMIFFMTILILFILIVLPILFLGSDSKETANAYNINQSDITGNQVISFPKGGKVKLYRSKKNTVEEIDLEDYITGVVSSEVPADFNENALKAQAVAARTYYMNKRNNPCELAKKHNAEICDTTNCQVYMSKEERLKTWGKSKAEENWNKIEKAVKDTSGEVLTYDGKLLEYPQFFSTSWGKTEDAAEVFNIDVPYLKPQESSGEEIAPKYETKTSLRTKEFIQKINSKYSEANLSESNIKDNIKILSYTEGGAVKEIQIGNARISGTDFRSYMGLNSANFTVEVSNQMVNIMCKGYGHGVGMSQWGANVMGKNGYAYDEILKHYYSGCEIDKMVYK